MLSYNAVTIISLFSLESIALVLLGGAQGYIFYQRRREPPGARVLPPALLTFVWGWTAVIVTYALTAILFKMTLNQTWFSNSKVAQVQTGVAVLIAGMLCNLITEKLFFLVWIEPATGIDDAYRQLFMVFFMISLALLIASFFLTGSSLLCCAGAGCAIHRLVITASWWLVVKRLRKRRWPVIMYLVGSIVGVVLSLGAFAGVLRPESFWFLLPYLSSWFMVFMIGALNVATLVIGWCAPPNCSAQWSRSLVEIQKSDSTSSC